MSEQQLTSAADLKAKSAAQLSGIITLPDSGAVVQVGRVRRRTFLKAERLPQSLLSAAIEQQKEKDGASVTPAEFTRDDLLGMEAFKDQVIIDCTLSLKIVRENPVGDEVALSDLSDNDQDAIYNFAMSGARPVEMEGGESLTHDELATFREEQGIPGAGDDSQNIPLSPIDAVIAAP